MDVLVKIQYKHWVLFHLYTCFISPRKLAVFLLTVLLSFAVRATPPSFFVTINALTSTPSNQLLLVTADPFGYSVVIVTNGQGDVITNSPGDTALDFSPEGTLYGSAGDVLSIINPSTGVASNVGTLSNAATGALTSGAALTFGSDGTLYLSDGYSLYTADPTSGACARINPFHTNNATTKFTTPIYGLAAAPNGTLFGADLNLYTINPATAAATAIGLICDYPWFAQSRDMAFGTDGNLYMIGVDFFGDTALYSVDTNNASVTWLGQLPGQAFGIVNSTSPTALVITSQPSSQTVAPGGKASFSVAATGYPTPTPTWYFDEAPYPSGTNFVLTVTNVAATNAGSYFVVLTNTSSTVTSAVVTLTVSTNIVSTNFTFLATSASGGIAADSILSLSTNPVSETVLAALDTSLSCLSFNTNHVLYGANDVLYRIDTNSWATTAIGPILTTNDEPLTLSGMAFSPQDILYGIAAQALYTINTNSAVAALVNSYQDQEFYDISAIAFGPDGVLYGGEFDLYTIDPTSGVVTYEIGALLGQSILGDMKVGADGYIYFNGGDDSNPDLNLYQLNPLTAQVSRVAGFNSDLVGLAFYPAPFDSKPPSVTSPPVNEVAALGGIITLSVTATGSGPLTYQWSDGQGIVQDGSRISGARTSSVTISNLMQSDAGTYSVAISNSFGALTNTVATLVVGAGPVITVQPVASTRIVEGRNLTLNVAASGAAPLLYQWMIGDTIIAGATSRTLTLTANPVNGVTNPFYAVLIHNSFGATLSGPAEVLVLPDITKPSVAITLPSADARTTNNAIAGTASADAIQVVYWTTNINNGVVSTSGPVAATLGDHSTWSAAPTLLPGTNLLAVQSGNQYGNVSALVSRAFFYEIKAPLTLTITGGSGTFIGKAAVPGNTAPASGALLNIGEGYSLTAKPAADSLFANWSGSAGIVTTPAIKFIMENNLNLIANLVTNQFFGLAGVYNGLFPNRGEVTEATSGMISDLTVTSGGVYSGALILQGFRHGFSGSFNMDWLSSNSIPHPGGALVVQMQILTNTYPNQIHGSVSGNGWESDLYLIANASGPLPSAAGTMVLPPALVVLPGTNLTGGYGYAVITNHAGSVSFNGKLPDGAIFNPTVPISEATNVPFYASLYGNTGVLTGWLDFDTNEYGAQVPQGQLTWIRKPGAPGSPYSGGLTDVVMVQGSSWVAPAKGEAALPLTTNSPGLLEISDGNLATPLSFLVAVASNNSLTKLPSSLSTNTLTGFITPKTGLLTITFGNGKGDATTSGTGVVLQNSNVADGTFLGTTNSGSIRLDGVFP
jgi:hypothetical protein